jgi:hypothetical protein
MNLNVSNREEIGCIMTRGMKQEEWGGKTQQWKRREKGRRTKHLEKDARHLCSGANT